MLKARASFDWRFSSLQQASASQYGIFLGCSSFPAVLSIFGSPDFSHTPVFGGPRFV